MNLGDELQAAVSVLTTLCLSDGDCGGGGKGGSDWYFAELFLLCLN
jgi:hypothetical protein